MSPRFFYDSIGSALFEEITQLSEYYLTRVEGAILGAHAAEIAYDEPLGGMFGGIWFTVLAARRRSC